MVAFKHILVPLDGRPLAESAIPVAEALAHKFDGQITLLRPTTVARKKENGDGEQKPQRALSYLKARQTELCRKGIDVKILLNYVSPAQSILDVATDCDVDIIVMSMYWRGGRAHWAAGNVAQEVAHSSPCPVLLVRHQPQAAESS